MFLTMASARLPCCTTLSRLPFSVSVSSVISARALSFNDISFRVSCNSSINSADSPEKLLTKLSGGNACGKLTERGELLCLHEAVLRCAQILQRFRQFAG